MSALVSVTICTADRQIHRFQDFESADRFSRSFFAVGGAALAAPRHTSVRKNGENRRLILEFLAKQSGTTVDIAASMSRTVHVINKRVANLLVAGLIEVEKTGARGQRHYRITDAGRAEVARHV